MSNPYGLMAEFTSVADLKKAAKTTHDSGYKMIDAYSPFPVEGLAEMIGFHRDRVSLVTLIGGLIGAASGYGLQYWVANIAYPTNIGGRPLHSWPAFIIVTFEMTVLFAGLSATFGMLALNGLPEPYHPNFNVKAFERATQDRFFLCVFASDPKFDATQTRKFLEGFKPVSISEVPE
jgi:hypothetical protein